MKKIFRLFAGKKKFQRLFQFLLRIALRGLNYENGGNFNKSGELRLLKFLAKKYENENNLILFDVGGNIGDYSKSMSEIFGKNALIYSFEPSAKTYSMLLETIKNNHNIRPYNIGFSDKEHNQTLYTVEDGSGIASVYKRQLEHFGVTMNKFENIQLLTIDNFCKNNKIERIHFLKLDIEGHELSALQGAKDMIENGKINYIQFEFGGCNIDSKTYFQDFWYLLKDKYKIYRILEDGITEIFSYKEELEIFLTVNFLAIKK